MNDNRMDQLVRMAMEAEELEFGTPTVTERPMLRLVGSEADDEATPVRARAWWIGAGVLAAAGIALASALPLLMRPTDAPSHTGGGIATGPAIGPDPRDLPSEAPHFRRHQSLEAIAVNGGGTTPFSFTAEYALSPEPPVCAPHQVAALARGEDRIDPGTVQQCVVLSIYRDNRGTMHSVCVKPQEWPGNKCLSEVTPQEIRTAGIGQACAPAADRGLVVAMAGPRRALPKTEFEAEGVARCILGGGDSRHGCADDLGCYASAAAGCVSPEVAVKVESIAGR